VAEVESGLWLQSTCSAGFSLDPATCSGRFGIASSLGMEPAHELVAPDRRSSKKSFATPTHFDGRDVVEAKICILKQGEK